MADSHLENPSDCVSLFVDHHDGLHQTSVGEHPEVDLVQSDIVSNGQDEDEEPDAKRLRSEDDYTETITIDWNDDNVKQTLFNVNRALTLRLDDLENKYEILVRTVEAQNKKLQAKAEKNLVNRGRGAAVVVGLPQDGPAQMRNAFTAPGGNVTLITLNSEEDYPGGVWLGDENNPEMRVRVPINSSDLLHIHSNCRTPEKMALTMLDYLFDRDTQAMSNLSGTGKHGKKQLDPLKIYGIRCHLIHKFGIREQDWHRIRLNIDSKCRTAYRRKMRGKPMIVKGFREHKDDELLAYATVNLHEDNVSHQLHMHEVEGGETRLAVVKQGLNLDGNGELQIIHATEEQLLHLQRSQQIQILDDNQVSAELLQQLQSQSGAQNRVISVSVSNVSEHTSSDTVVTEDIEYDGNSSQLQVHEPEIVEGEAEEQIESHDVL